MFVSRFPRFAAVRPFAAVCGVVAVGLCVFTSPQIARAQVYVANSASNNIASLTNNGATVTTLTTTGLNVPIGLTFGVGGDLFVSNSGNNTISRVNPTTGTTSLFATVATVDGGLRFSSYRASTSDLFVTASNTAGNIFRINALGQVSTFATLSNFAPNGITLASNGDLFVTQSNGSSGRISRVDGSTGAVTTLVNTTSNALQGLAFDTSGNLFVADKATNSILRILAGSSTLTAFATLPDVNSAPSGLAFLPNGNLLVAQANINTISQLTPDGTASRYANYSGGGQPQGIAIMPTAGAPEPGSLALVGMGAAPLAGLVARRRRKTTA